MVAESADSKDSIPSNELGLQPKGHSSKKRLYWYIFGGGLAVIITLVILLFWLESSKEESILRRAELKEESVEEVPDNLARFATSYPSELRIQSIGKEWDWTTVSPQEGQLLYGEGIIQYPQESPVWMVCVVTKDGYIYGRYFHSNGIQLDINGIVQLNGDIKMQLGHGNEISNMNLYPIPSASSSNEFAYSGTWGKNDKAIDITFFEKSHKLGYQFKTIKKTYDGSRLNKEYEWTPISQSIYVSLPYGLDGKLLPGIESFVKHKYNKERSGALNEKTSLETFLTDYVKTDADGKKIEPKHESIYYFGHWESNILSPVISNDNFIVMESQAWMSEGGSSFGGSTYLIITLDKNKFSQGIINPKDIFKNGITAELKRLLIDNRPPGIYSEINEVPEDMIIERDYITFVFPQWSFDLPTSEGEPKIKVPMASIKNFLKPEYAEMIETARGWQTHKHVNPE